VRDRRLRAALPRLLQRGTTRTLGRNEQASPHNRCPGAIATDGRSFADHAARNRIDLRKVRQRLTRRANGCQILGVRRVGELPEDSIRQGFLFGHEALKAMATCSYYGRTAACVGFSTPINALASGGCGYRLGKVERGTMTLVIRRRSAPI